MYGTYTSCYHYMDPMGTESRLYPLRKAAYQRVERSGEVIQTIVLYLPWNWHISIISTVSGHFLVDDFPFARVGYEIVPCRETHLRTNRVTYHQYTQKANHIPAWQFCVAFLGWLSDPPDVSISDLQVGDQKVTLNNWLVKFSWKQHVVGGWTSPFEKYACQIGSFPPILGLNKKKEVSPSKNKKILKSPPSIGMVTVTSLTPIDIQQQHQCVFSRRKLPTTTGRLALVKWGNVRSLKPYLSQSVRVNQMVGKMFSTNK